MVRESSLPLCLGRERSRMPGTGAAPRRTSRKGGALEGLGETAAAAVLALREREGCISDSKVRVNTWGAFIKQSKLRFAFSVGSKLHFIICFLN